MLVRNDNKAAVSYINHQDLLLSRALHIPGHRNTVTDILSQGNPLSEWRLHPQIVEQIWAWYREGQMWTSSPRGRTHTALCGTGSERKMPPLLSMDALALPLPESSPLRLPPSRDNTVTVRSAGEEGGDNSVAVVRDPITIPALPKGTASRNVACPPL
ncbi:hypothetical protein AAFF_G00220560 [Aldrovandia affinis]|uniref:Uncharacterized protein n=1 Tax=Aldrovandia affinis TaxID=143900 RepID=A0AAD7W4V8_9TELE|nr:hypothetical protein AAFF_G00220560 [Aldrovandia affinis]